MMMTAPVRIVNMPASRLAQAPPPSIEITRELADAVKVAILTLIQDPGDPEIYTREACWRELRSRRWPQVTALRNKITKFMETTEQAFMASDDEWALIELIIECVETIGAQEEAETGATIETVGALIGVAGGLATLVALF